MKKAISKIILIVIVLFQIAGCSIFKDKAVEETKSLINDIGKVTTESLEKINLAEQSYLQLTDKQKEKVENINVLEEAKDKYLFLFAQSIYEDITNVANICTENMGLYEDAWYYGINEDNPTIDGLSVEIDLTSDEVDTALRQMDWDKELLDILYPEEFSAGLLLLDEVFKIRRVFDDAKEILANAKNKLKTLENDYPDYEYTQQLIDYYSKVNSYLNFALDHNESYNSFTEKTKDYEKSINELKTGLEYEFGESL